MTYALLDDSFYDHPRFANVDDDLVGIWAKGLAYCNRYMTDGDIPKGKALSFCVTVPRDTIVARMVSAKLWIDRGLYVVHIGYLDHNPSREQVQARLLAAKNRKDKWRQNASGTLPGIGSETGQEHVPERVPHTYQNGSSRARAQAGSDPIRSDPIRSQKQPLSPDGDRGVVLVFEHWVKVLAHLKFKRTPALTPERRRLIAARLRDFTPSELCQAIDGVRRSKHLCGENDRGEVYVDFETIFRNRTKVEGHIARAEANGHTGAPLDARDLATQRAQLGRLRPPTASPEKP